MTLIKPPHVVTKLGIVPEGCLWEAQGALYGLRESPEDWSQHRNLKMLDAKWLRSGKERHLEQSAESNIWYILNNEDNICGYFATYVDDIVTVGPEAEVHGALQCIETLWKCSKREVLSGPEDRLKFCGFQVERTTNGYHLDQKEYILDLCSRKGVVECVKWRGVTISDEDEQFDIPTLREAQGLVGELQWLSGRTRPDITHATGVLSRQMRRKPAEVALQARALLGYVKATADWGLHYEKCDGEASFGDMGELKYPN